MSDEEGGDRRQGGEPEAGSVWKQLRRMESEVQDPEAAATLVYDKDRVKALMAEVRARAGEQPEAAAQPVAPGPRGPAVQGEPLVADDEPEQDATAVHHPERHDGEAGGESAAPRAEPFVAHDEPEQDGTVVYQPERHAADGNQDAAPPGEPFVADDEPEQDATAVYDPARHGDGAGDMRLDRSLLPSSHLSAGRLPAPERRIDWLSVGLTALAAIMVLVALAALVATAMP